MKTSGIKTVKFGKWRLQLYWPNVTLRYGQQSEIHLGLDTTARFVIDRRNGLYAGAGFNLVGFGVGFDYFRERPVPQHNQQLSEKT